MSDNSYIYLTWIKDHYEITHRDADNPNNQFGRVKKAKDLRDAVLKAKSLQTTYWPEYGITVGMLENEEGE